MRCTVLLVAFVAQQALSAVLFDDDYLSSKGCSNNCGRVTDVTYKCPEGQKCNGQNVRHLVDVIDGCAITACASGTLNYASAYADFIVCKNGQWFAKGSSLGATPSVTCSLQNTCKACKAPATTTECPAGRNCDASLLTQNIMPDTGCAAYQCQKNMQLMALHNGVWRPLNYLDCHHDKWWRFDSVYTVQPTDKVSITCAEYSVSARVGLRSRPLVSWRAPFARGYDSIDGCTNDCMMITDGTNPCPAGQTCKPDQLRQIYDLIPGCTITSCVSGSLQYGENTDFSDFLVCKSGEWYGKGKNFGRNPKTNCGLRKTCLNCKTPDFSKGCPSGRSCSTDNIKAGIHPESGCKIYTCPAGSQLMGKNKGDWRAMTYLDCHHDVWWRYDSIFTAKGDLEITCAAL